MKRVLVLVFVFAALAACGAGSAPRTDKDAGTQGVQLASGSKINLAVGEHFWLLTPGVARLAIGDPTVADVKPVGADTLEIVGQAAGTTELLVWSASGTKDSFTIVVL